MALLDPDTNTPESSDLIATTVATEGCLYDKSRQTISCDTDDTFITDTDLSGAVLRGSAQVVVIDRCRISDLTVYLHKRTTQGRTIQPRIIIKDSYIHGAAFAEGTDLSYVFIQDCWIDGLSSNNVNYNYAEFANCLFTSTNTLHWSDDMQARRMAMTDCEYQTDHTRDDVCRFSYTNGEECYRGWPAVFRYRLD